MCRAGLHVRCWGGAVDDGAGRVGRLGRAHRALGLPALGSAAGRGVELRWLLTGGFDLGIGSDGYFDY